MPQSFSIKLHSETQVSGRLGMSGGISPRHCIKIWYGCSLGNFDDLINFWDESIKNKMAAAAIKKK